MSNELTFFDRQRLQFWLRTKMSLRKISKLILKDHSVITREIQRNSSGRDKYRADIAQKLCEERKIKKRKGKLEKYPKLKNYVENKLGKDWSPEQIAGRLNESNVLDGLTISHESIYCYIYEKSEKYKKLYQHLRTNRAKRFKWGKRKSKETSIKDRVSIQDRPLVIENRERYGDWESDTVEFKRVKNGKYLSVQYERKSQLVRIHKLNNKGADETLKAIIKTGNSLHPKIFRSVTFDNGLEGSKHHLAKDLFEIETYFCDSFKSWQKGGVENMNKLIRQYLPRNTNLENISNEDIYLIQEKLNNRPRKKLSYRSPNEVLKSGALLT